ncbi:MAG: serine/threonine-protein kinase [Chloroflexota bacterium]
MANISNTLSTQLTRYKIKERLGSGGMATVYRATDTNLDREVAIKVLHEHLLYEKTFKERFVREARLIASLNHPNIIQIYDFDTLESDSGKVYFMVMNYLPGDTLIDVMTSCRADHETLAHEKTRHIVKDLAEALDYAHERDMIHRDVKPANIIFTDDEHVVLTDFGIARLAQGSNLTQEDTIIGTPAYMSPEQATGQPIDHRSDIYSLGVILFELLTGRPPFDDESTVSLLLKHVQMPPPSVSEFMQVRNPALDAVLNRALAKRPEDRYQSAMALYNELESAIMRESDTERFKPGTLPKRPEGFSAGVKTTTPPATEVLDMPPTKSNAVTRTIQTLVIKPARQNPLGFAALAIAIISFLLIARISQQTANTAPTVTEIPAVVDAEDDEDLGTSSMAGMGMLGDAAFFFTDFADDDPINVYWQRTPDSAVQRTIEDGAYRISTDERDLATTSLLDPEFIYEDVHIVLEGTLLEDSASPASAFGIIFRYQDNENYNVFAIDGRGRYSVWKLENDVWCELRTACNGGDATDVWEQNEAIQRIGQSNTIDFLLADDTLLVTVNDEFVTFLDESTFGPGPIGIYMATTSQGGATALIENIDIQLGESPTSSMTGE